MSAYPLRRVTSPEKDERGGAYDDPRRVLARIQGDLERVAAGKERSKLPEGVKADELEAFVGAYQRVLSGDASADAELAKVAESAKKRLSALVEKAKAEEIAGDSRIEKKHAPADYLKVVSAIAEAKPKGAEGTMIRLAATMRLVDAVLVLESGIPMYNAVYDLFKRSEGSFLRPTDLYRDAVFLRLPCRTITDRRALVEAAAKKLDQAAGPLLSCPVPEGHERDWDLMERFSKDPAEAASAVLSQKPEAKKPKAEAPEPVAPAKPWGPDAALVFMADDPDEADRVLSAEAAKGLVQKLDYALFLHAFRPQSKERDEKIKKLQAEVDKASDAVAKKNEEAALLEDESVARKAYDGTDESLIGTLRVASEYGRVQTFSAFYAIPCAVLLARPKLVDATSPIFGSNRDNFLPRSGCGWGLGFVRGFPSADLSKWRDATEAADGNFYMNHGGTLRFALAGVLNEIEETMRANPKKLLEDEDAQPKMAWPYETWSYMTPESRTIYERLLGISKPLHEKLVDHYKKRGLGEDEAKKAALAGLFRVVWGANCGDAAPPKSLRKLVVDGAPVDEIRAFIQSDALRDGNGLKPFEECAKNTGEDPLVHVAVRNPAALSVLWEIPPGPEDAKALDLVVDPNAPNDFGKTPLMAAAQQDQVESARLLLDHGASPFATTFKELEPKLRHDARTALMYAAARGSLPMIKLLIDAGADKFAADTTGKTALHYLLGSGPVPANAKLSPAEFSEAAKLLY